MALEYDLRGIANRDLSDKGWAITESVIVATLITRVGILTEDNYQEWWGRYSIFSPDGMVKLADVRRHIGLKTNVYPDLTREQWARTFIPNIIAERIAQAVRAEADAANANEVA